MGKSAGMPLHEQVTRLTKGPYLAAVSTLMPDGTPQSQFTWIDSDGEHVLINTEPQRQRSKNVQRDPRVTVLVLGDNAWDWVEVRGRVVESVGGQEARDHIDELSRRYRNQDYQNPIGPHGRVILKIAPDRVNTPSGPV
jgi:PPOX class probable F420-dependent enzyme